MALLDAEVDRIRYELGFNLLAAGAEPYVSVVALFDQVVQPYLRAGNTTTSDTVVAVATTPTPVTIVLASATGFAVGDRVVIDDGANQERATITRLSGSSITLDLQLAHAAGYQVSQERGEEIVRGILAKLYAISDELGDSAMGAAGIRRVDEIEFFGGDSANAGNARLTGLKDLRMYWRDELGGALGVPNMWRTKGGSGSGSSTVLY